MTANILKNALEEVFEIDDQIWKENTRKQVLFVLALYYVIEISINDKEKMF